MEQVNDQLLQVDVFAGVDLRETLALLAFADVISYWSFYFDNSPCTPPPILMATSLLWN
jgi:hypothetical protein